MVMSFKLAYPDGCERAGNWQLVRRTLELRAFGIDGVKILPGEQIPEHDEVDRGDGEVFYVLSGSPRVIIDGKDYPAHGGTFARLDPAHSPTVRNDGIGPPSVPIISTPESSGCEPMDWA